MKKENLSESFSDLKYKIGSEKLQPFKLKLLELINSTEDRKGKALDIGCGSGIISSRLTTNLSPIGIDISLEGLKKYRQKGFNGIFGNVESPLPFKSESFQVIILSEVIEHINNYQRLIKESFRVLVSGGTLYITTTNSAYLYYRLLYLIGKTPTELQHPFHLRFFSYKMLVKQLKEHGFHMQAIWGQNVFMFVPDAILRRIQKKNQFLGNLLIKFLTLIGFRHSEGLIHGDKYILYRFSKSLNNLFSNTIMIIASR